MQLEEQSEHKIKCTDGCRQKAVGKNLGQKMWDELFMDQKM
jgi:hypothetical protein